MIARTKIVFGKVLKKLSKSELNRILVGMNRSIVDHVLVKNVRSL